MATPAITFLTNYVAIDQFQKCTPFCYNPESDEWVEDEEFGKSNDFQKAICVQTQHDDVSIMFNMILKGSTYKLMTGNLILICEKEYIPVVKIYSERTYKYEYHKRPVGNFKHQYLLGVYFPPILKCWKLSPVGKGVYCAKSTPYKLEDKQTFVNTKSMIITKIESETRIKDLDKDIETLENKYPTIIDLSGLKSKRQQEFGKYTETMNELVDTINIINNLPRNEAPIKTQPLKNRIYQQLKELSLFKKEICPISREELTEGNITITICCGTPFSTDNINEAIQRRNVCPHCITDCPTLM
jgi:hypothetical protein